MVLSLCRLLSRNGFGDNDNTVVCGYIFRHSIEKKTFTTSVVGCIRNAALRERTRLSFSLTQKKKNSRSAGNK